MENKDNNTKRIRSLILASNSPRRKELLDQAGIKFTIIPSLVDESKISLSYPEDYALHLSKLKATDISKKYPDHWVLGADTIVLIDNQILGKPKSKNDARNMLNKLQGNIHKVITGYTLCYKSSDRLISKTVVTDVRFKKLTRYEIEWYIHTKEPYDKAGSYAIQGLGSFLVHSINGSYSNVVGLPICEVIESLKKQNIIRLNIGHEDYVQE